MVEKDDVNEISKKLSELGAYIIVLKEDVAKLDEMHVLASTLQTETRQLKDEVNRLRSAVERLQRSAPLNAKSIRVNEKAIGRVFAETAALKKSFDTLKDSLQEYPEIKAAYNDVKGTIIKILVAALLLCVSASLGVSAIYNSFG